MTQWHQIGRWPAQWIRGSAATPPQVTVFHLAITLTAPSTIPVRVSGDERFEFYVNGACLSRGPERGDKSMWHYHSHTLQLAAGSHHLAALVWSLGDQAAYAQIGHSHSLIVASDDQWHTTVATGSAPWQAKSLCSYSFTKPKQAWGTGCNIIFDARQHDWDWQHGAGTNWQTPISVYHGEDTLIDYELGSGKHLQPAPLPAMRHDPRNLGTVRYIDDTPASQSMHQAVEPTRNHVQLHTAWQALLAGTAPLTIPAHTSQRVIIDIDEYVCAYPQLTISGGRDASLRLDWEEALSSNPSEFVRVKTNRNEINGKFFNGVGDTFISDGSPHATHTSLWWQSGRYIEICVATADEPLVIEQIAIAETGYPFQFSGTFDCDDQRLTAVIPMMQRVLQMCAHETYMDCPYYEQLMYVGDTRLEALVTHVLTSDDRLPAKAIKLFHQSRIPSNLTQSRYPSRVQQIIPPFSLWWIAMVHDIAYWRDQPDLVKTMLPGIRNVLDAFVSQRRPDGLINPPAGWNFVDWVPDWQGGMPPLADRHPCATINWHLVYTLELAADLENHYGEASLATRWHTHAAQTRDALDAHLWDAAAGVYYEVAGQSLVSEHAQCLAILSGIAQPDHIPKMQQALQTRPDMARATIYFSHYLFETYRTMGAIDLLLQRMQLWFDLPAQGLKTTVEMPEPSRSDCHAWGSHPLFHYHASVVGVRPAAPGFAQVAITPQLGPLQRVSAVTPHPNGHIHSAFWRDNGVLRGQVTLPAGVSGIINLSSGTVHIAAGGTTTL